MKKLFFLITMLIILTSCDNDPIRVKDSDKATTIALQQLVANDTNCYKIAEVDNKLYVLQDNKVVIESINTSGVTYSLLLIIMGMMLLFFIGAVILTN